MTIDQLIRLLGRWLPGATLICLLPFVLIHGLPSPSWDGVGAAVLSILFWTGIAVAVYAISALVHEALHVLAMLIVARVPIGSLRFGARLSEGVLYVHSDRPMSATSYRVVLLTPAILQGILPTIAGTLAGVGWLVVYGYVMVISSVGDFAVFQLIRHLDRRAVVRDHPEKVGCQVMST